MTITPELEQSARYLGVLLALLILAYRKEWHRGGLLLVVQLWARETLYHLHRYVRSIQPPSEDWISTRIRATSKGTGRYWRGRMARAVRMRKYMRTWEAQPDFQAEMKRHASKRIAAVARRGQ